MSPINPTVPSEEAVEQAHRAYLAARHRDQRKPGNKRLCQRMLAVYVRRLAAHLAGEHGWECDPEQPWRASSPRYLAETHEGFHPKT